MSLLLLDNYDSFTWNLVELLRQCRFTDFVIKKNDEIELADIAEFDRILISPGPGIPPESGITMPMIRTYAATKKILGICLGHQSIAEVFGGKLYRLETVCHGICAKISVHDPSERLFRDLPATFPAGLYHSWAVDPASLPACFQVTANSGDGVIMGLRHKEFDLSGLQFHPESVMTPQGGKILDNWLNG